MLDSRVVGLLAAGLFAFGCGSETSSGSPAGSGGSGGVASGGSGGVGGSGGAAGAQGEVVSLYSIPADLAALVDDTFFEHPWPSDFRYRADGTVRFEGYPNQRFSPLLEDYKRSVEGVLKGFSPAASGFLRFSGPLDPASLPQTPLEALDPSSSVQLIDIDPASPELGERRRISLYWRRDAGVYWHEYTLAFMPTLGFPLRRANRYALVVTRDVLGEGGGAVAPSAELQQVLGLEDSVAPQVSALKAKFADAVSALGDAGIDKGSVAHLTVFTTTDPTAETVTLRDWTLANYPAPTATDWTAEDQNAGLMDVYQGNYGPSPDFQRGTLPFIAFGDGGELAFAADGTPELQREYDQRFALSVPDATACPMPADGYPIVLYAHGTGGNYRSFLGRDDEGESLAAQCIATMGVDQIFHGTRPGADDGTQDLLFFNVSNPTAARANGPQSAIDVVQQARLFTESNLTVPAAVSRTGAEIRFDETRVMFFGHSQGGLNGPMFLAIDDQARGGVLSGSGGLISITLLEKTKPVDVAGLVRQVFLGLRPEEYEELNFMHPMMSLAQTIVDPTDPIHYVPMLATEPRPGFAPKSILMTEGVNPDFSGDSFTPPHAIEVQAIALGLPPQNPVIHTPEELVWSDLQPVTIPPGGLSGNLAGGQASGILAQWPADQASDGHFVIYDIPAAMQQCAGFVRNLADDPVGRVPAP